MKMISKINSISSLNDKNLEKFSLSNNNNTRFLATKSYIDFLPGGSSNFSLESQSAKSLKFNNNSDNSSASAVFWDNFTKPLPGGGGLSSLPASSTTNLRNTVSSSNLALNINYTDNQPNPPSIPMVLPQKFQFNQPQAQPMLKTSSSGSSVHDDQQLHQLQQALCSRKNSLPHGSLINNNHSTNNSSSSSSFKEISDLSVNGVSKNNGKLNASATLTSTSSNEMQLQHQNANQSDQQNKSQPSKWPVVASPHQVRY